MKTLILLLIGRYEWIAWREQKLRSDDFSKQKTILLSFSGVFIADDSHNKMI